MSKKKIGFFILVLLIVFTFVIASFHWRVRAHYFRYQYDLNYKNEPITSKKQINEVLQQFEKVSFNDLEGDYKAYTLSNQPAHQPSLKGKKYFVLHRDDFFKRLVGYFRVEDFLAKDKYYKKCMSSTSNSYYVLLDERLLGKVLDLQDELERLGYRRWGFDITNGHRHPMYNKWVGGASKSRHILGEAVDIRVNDIDGNSRYDKKDKDIILEILENKVIRNSGGIGRYPGTRAVHFDVRGFRARWDSY